MLPLPIACGSGEASHPGLAANAHHFRQGGNLVTGANWNTSTTPVSGNATTKAPVVAERSKIDDPDALADEPMTPGRDNEYMIATGPASTMFSIPPPPAPAARIKAEKASVASFPCFICDQTFANQARFMFIHACRMHAGEPILPSARARLSAIERGLCSTEGCGAIRKYSEIHCRRCRTQAPVRHIRDGDVVPASSTCPIPALAEDPLVSRTLSGEEGSQPGPQTGATLP